MNIRFLALAQQEVDEALWFDETANGKGRDFLDDLDRVFA